MKDKEPESGYISSVELAIRLGLSVGAVENWRYQKRGPKWKKLGTGKNAPIRYAIEDVKTWEKENN